MGKMTGVAVSVGAVTLTSLYRAAFNVQRGQLQEIVTTQARLIEAVARFDAEFSATDVAGGSFSATLGQVRDAHAQLGGFGDTGEFLVGIREGDQIAWLLSDRDPVPLLGTTVAEPMRRALSGESGAIVGLDYSGRRVLAAYERWRS